MPSRKIASIKKGQNYSIIFEKLDELKKKEDSAQSIDEVNEIEEIRTLREIILAASSQEKCYLTTT